MRLERAMLEIAARQRGCIGDWQVRALGGTATEIKRIHRSSSWTTPVDRVLGVRGAVEDDGFCASAAVLAAGDGARLGYESAGAWWGVRMFSVLPPTVVQLDPLGHRRRQQGTIHRPRALVERWTTTHRGIAIVRPELLCYQLCAVLHDSQAERAFDVAWSMRLLSVSSARMCLVDLAKRGRNGTQLYRRILDARNDKDMPPASSLESRVQQLLDRAGVTMARQVSVGGDQWHGRIDFKDRQLPLILEVQSEIHHTSLTDERRDAERHAQYDQDGFEVLAVWENDIWTRAAYVIAQIHEARRRARRRASGNCVP